MTNQSKPFDYCDPKQEYQGWTNAQTWCVAITIDNDRELLERAIATIKKYPQVQPSFLMESYSAIFSKFQSMSAWCWDQGQTLNDVNWQEIKNHYATKASEQTPSNKQESES